MHVFAKAALLALALGLPHLGMAETLLPEKRAIFYQDADLPGGDFTSIFDTNIEACERACISQNQCEAFTFNTRNGSCFLKADPGSESYFEGALSAEMVVTPAAAQDLAQTRRAELSFLSDWDFSSALEQAQTLGRSHTSGSWSAEEHLQSAQISQDQGDWDMALAYTGAALNREDRAGLWLDYATRALLAADNLSDNRSWYQNRALQGAINGYLRAENPAERHSILVEMARALEQLGRGRETVQALRLAQSLQERSDTADYLADAASKYGFRLSDSSVQADLANPQICAQFSEDLRKAGVDYADYVKLPEAGLAVEASGRQLCITGLSHGQTYRVTLREGLPAADGQSLAKDVELSLYIRDRNPGVRFPGRGYVLPAGADPALPIETVNSDKLDLKLYKVTDRNLLRAIQQNFFGMPISIYDEEYFGADFGSEVWSGEARVTQEVNRDVTTRLPMAEALKGQSAGIYALKAEVPGTDPYNVAAAWQWFVVSDLGLTSMSGVDGLHVFLRSLATADAKAGVEVELLSRANAVLATAVTDEMGYARFDAGLTRGQGSAAPGMLVVREGESDIGFLSLSDPEFDLADRGVAGREAAPPLDVFLTTDRGAYRAGETVYATALARDPQMKAVEGLPLTAVLTRPDGVEYSRQLVADGGAGGHVFSLPIAGSAQRGLWSLAILADREERALTRTTFLVEDFLPERIDFTLDAGAAPLSLAEPSFPLEIEARYLFGAPGADLSIEGEVLLRSADELTAWPGYVFGRHDQVFSNVIEGLGQAKTGSDGHATLDAALPQVGDPGRPLTAKVVVRVAEGSGRPVERQIEKEVAPLSAMIGVKPEFDGVVGEGSEARFLLAGVGRDLKPEAMSVAWTLTRIETDYQWYQSYGNWNWEPVTQRTPVAEGTAELGADPVAISAAVNWGQYELSVRSIEGQAETSTTFWAGWYAPADVSATPDTLELSLDKPDYAPGETAQLRLVPRAAGTALVTVLSNRLIHMEAVEVEEGENIISLDVTEDWGAGVYVTASVLRPMDVAAGRNPTRALGLSYAKVSPGTRALSATIEAPAEADPRGALEVAVKVEGIASGETAYVTLAAVDEGILNLTGFKAPDPQGYYFGQRKLGMGLRDVYGRLIDGMNGAMGEVRSGGDAGAQARLQAPPPTEELLAYFSGPIEVGADGYARSSFTLPAFNGSVKLMAVAWSKSGIGQDEAGVLVRDPVVVTASLPRFMAPGDESRLLLEIVHASGPSGEMGLATSAEGLTLGSHPASLRLEDQGKAVVEVPVSADVAGLYEIEVDLTTPDGKVLKKTLLLPVELNDPESVKISRFDLAAGESFTLDQSVFADFHPGTARGVMTIGPLARLNAPGLLASLDRYPYGCTEQMTSVAMPLLYFDDVAKVMDLKGAKDLQKRIDDAVAAILLNQGSDGGFGLWGPANGDLWLDAYVSDFLSRAKAQGYQVPDLAFRNALANLRNHVNAAPNFDAESNGRGEDLAYALMVLAREGAAAIGDLRYYADVKGDDFGSALAKAQLGAALAAYGDQTRADMMFAKAASAAEAAVPGDEGQYWRADYGTNLRDWAAVLALAVESGSNAVDREAFADRIARHKGRLSTQEASWTLMAAHGLSDGAALPGLEIDGAAVSGALVRMFDEGAAPIAVTNGGTATTITLTTYGVTQGEEPAGGNGYAIERRYYSMEGEPLSLDRVAQGTRMVVVLEVTPLADGEGRLMVADPLPAGFEIDNPNLMAAGDTGNLAWLDTISEVSHSEFRQDRFLTALDWSSSQSFRLAYVVRAVTPGVFHHPAASVEDMYRPDFRARSAQGRVVIE